MPEFQTKLGREFLDEFTGFSGAIKVRLLHVCVATSGDLFTCKPEKELRDLIQTEARKRTNPT